MSKRHAEESGSSNQPPIKKIHFEPHLIGPVSTLEEMDIKVLQFQNKKLAQVIPGPFSYICQDVTNYLTFCAENRTAPQNGSRTAAENRTAGEETNTRRCCPQRRQSLLESAQ